MYPEGSSRIAAQNTYPRAPPSTTNAQDEIAAYIRSLNTEELRGECEAKNLAAHRTLMRAGRLV